MNNNFADFYAERFSAGPKIFNDNPRNDTGIIVVIPCYEDKFIFKTLDSLNSAKKAPCSVEIIVIVNSSETTPQPIVERNQEIYDELQDCHFENFNMKSFLIKDVPVKIAGVGNARKIGMDEAVKRFAMIDNPRGIIVSLDADCLVDEDYFVEIYSVFSKNNKPASACVMQYHHDFDENLYSAEEICACKKYEGYMRYFRQAQKIAGFTNAVHTIGSCFAVTADVYTKVGGMSRRQAGEDFYFLEKTAQITNIAVINKPIVFPAPGISTRVPFGTGQSVKKIIEGSDYKVYNFELFLILKKFYDSFEDLYLTDDLGLLPAEILIFIDADSFRKKIAECRANASNAKKFAKRLMNKYDQLFMIRFLNSFDEKSIYPPTTVDVAVSMLLQYVGQSETADYYDDMYRFDLGIK